MDLPLSEVSSHPGMTSARVMYWPPEGVPKELAPAQTAIERLWREEIKQETAKQAADEDDQGWKHGMRIHTVSTAARPHVVSTQRESVYKVVINERSNINMRLHGDKEQNLAPHSDRHGFGGAMARTGVFARTVSIVSHSTAEVGWC